MIYLLKSFLLIYFRMIIINSENNQHYCGYRCIKLQIILSCWIADKINMLTNNKCDLPKVRLKFKTQFSDIANGQIQIPRLSKYDATPSIFPERLRMTKVINHAFMRYRKLKKNNYIKQFLNHKKSVSLTECKKIDTINPRNKITTFHKKLEIALECTFAKGFQDHNYEYLHRNKVQLLKSKNRQSKEALRINNNDLTNLKPHTILLKPKNKNKGNSFTLHDPALNCQQNPLGLEGFKCHQQETQVQRRQRTLRLLKKTKKQFKATRGSSSFLIQAWKQQKIYRGASYYLKNQYDSHQF